MPDARFTPLRGEQAALGSPMSALGGAPTVAQVVATIATRLSGFDDPEREARELLAALLDEPRHWPLTHADAPLQADVCDRATAAAIQRARGAPLAYAVGRANFRSLTLLVDPRVLIPRPETELLVDLVLPRLPAGALVVDVGTGSGAIALALATEGGGKVGRVIATDVSSDALDVARANAERMGVNNVTFALGSLLPAADAALAGARADAVVSNPPYISFAEAAELPPSVRDWEPSAALLSPGDGLAVTEALVAQAATRLAAGGLLALEVDARRARQVAELITSDKRFTDVTVHRDLSERERFVLASRREEEL